VLDSTFDPDGGYSDWDLSWFSSSVSSGYTNSPSKSFPICLPIRCYTVFILNKSLNNTHPPRGIIRTLDWGEWLASYSGRFATGGRSPIKYEQIRCKCGVEKRVSAENRTPIPRSLAHTLVAMQLKYSGLYMTGVAVLILCSFCICSLCCISNYNLHICIWQSGIGSRCVLSANGLGVLIRLWLFLFHLQ
jgi:hypothetical protein